MSRHICFIDRACSTPLPTIGRPVYPGGQGEHLKPGEVLIHASGEWQGLAKVHSSISLQVIPSPLIPLGHCPQANPRASAVSVQVTPG